MHSKSSPTAANGRPPHIWQPESFRHAPHLAFAALGASLITSGLALFIVRFADGKAVEDWAVSPSVYLSILATLSAMVLRFAFHDGAERYWWTLLLSRSGVKLHTLQSVWELYHDPMSRFAPMQDAEPVLRTAGIVLLLLAALGPLLQRAVVVDLDSRTTPLNLTLPIRREPMWNLTAYYSRHHSAYGRISSTPTAYHAEFARAARGLNQRTPIRLTSHDSACPPDSTCATTVTVASYGRTCTKEYVSDRDVKLLARLDTGMNCTHVSGDPDDPQPGEDGHCFLLSMNYQLQTLHIDHPTQNVSAPATWWQGEIPAPHDNHVYSALEYTSYYREEAGSDELALRRCNFTSAYVEMPVEITNRTVVTPLALHGDELSRRNRGRELIPALAFKATSASAFIPIGIHATMQDLYAGYAIFNYQDVQTLTSGIGPRQFIDQSTVDAETENSHWKFAFEDPVEAFTDTLHELALRYAVEKIASTRRRMEEIDLLFTTPYLQISSNNQPDPRPVMEEAIRELETKPAPTQRVLAQQTRQVAVYKANMLFAAIAVGMSFLATLLITLLFTGWQHLGRSFSASPLEIAKAFDAPLLRDAGSNVSGDEIAKSHGDVKVRYGEAIGEKAAAAHSRTGDESATEPETIVAIDANSSLDRHRSHLGDRHTATVNADVDAEADRNAVAQDPETVERGEANGLIAGTSKARLVIDRAERLSIPVRGRAYS